MRFMRIKNDIFREDQIKSVITNSDDLSKLYNVIVTVKGEWSDLHYKYEYKSSEDMIKDINSLHLQMENN